MGARLNKLGDFLSKKEKFVFLILAISNLFPLFSRPFYPFMDAPAHLYNSKLMYEMFFAHNEFLKEYITINPILVPNWMAHAIMFPLHAFFAPDTVEKMCLVIYFILFPFAFRYCVRAINGNVWFAYLAFPLAYNTLIFFSFYNFSFGLVFFLLTLGYFFKRIVFNDPKPIHYIALAFLLIATFFSHIVVLAVTWLAMMIVYMTSLKRSAKNEQTIFSAKTGFIQLALMPSMVLAAAYFMAFHKTGGEYLYQAKWDLLTSLLSGGYLKAYGQAENFNAGLVALIVNALFLVCIHSLLINDDKETRGGRKAMGVLALSLLAAYFFLPDSDGVGGYISTRLCILVLVAAFLFLSTFHPARPFLFILLLISMCAHYYRLQLFDMILKDRNRTVNLVHDQAAYIEPNSFLIFYKENNDWLDNHFYSYLCLDKPVVALQNYECATRYFPLVWKDTAVARVLYEDLFLLKNIERAKKMLKGRPVYYLLIGNTQEPNPTVASIKSDMERNCFTLSTTDYGTLYRLKQQ